MNRVDSHWFAVDTRSRHEKVVASKLEDKSSEVFLPLRKVLRRWKDRRKEVAMPLFSGYVFVRIPYRERQGVLHPYLKEGTFVRVVRGPLQGVEGILLEKRKKHILVLSVDLIQQSAALQVDISDTDVAGV